MSSLFLRLWAWLTGRVVEWPQITGPEAPYPGPVVELEPAEAYDPPLDAPQTPPQEPSQAPPRPKRPPSPRLSRRETARLRTDVLDQLADYQVYIKRLKRWDKEAYAQYRRLGAYVLVGDMQASPRELEPVFLKTLPGFGAVALGIHRDDKKPIMPGRFVYFMKLQRPGHDIEHVNSGATYRFQVYWDETDISHFSGPDRFTRQWNNRGHGYSGEWAVNVADDGRVRALRVLKNRDQVIRCRRTDTYQRLTSKGHLSTRHSSARPVDYVTHQRWGLHDPPDGMDEIETNPAKAICALFTVTMNFWVEASYHSMIRVTATKDNVVMPFIVDATDTPQFFADREPVVVDGVRKRIFHVVRAHARNTPKGTKGVRLHFAGLRRFTWNGYDIEITVPGREHLDIAEFNVGALEGLTDEEIAAEKHLDYYEMGDWLADQINAPAKLPRDEVEEPRSASG